MDNPDRTGYRKILVAFDGSDGARAALSRAAAFANEWNADVVLAECIRPFERKPERMIEPPENPAHAEAALTRMRQAVADLPEPLRADLRAIDGHPPEALLGLAEDVRADLLVIGSRGKALLRQAALGRVSSTLVSNAPCDVLVVQPELNGRQDG